MKFHKTYKITLALLAVMLAAIGTTGTVAHAKGPDDKLEYLSPSRVLHGEEMEMWRSLNTITQALLRDEIIPTISHGAGPQESQERELRSVVRALHKIQEMKEAAQASAASENICFFVVDASRNGASAFLNCAPYEMDSITVYVDLILFTGDSLGDDRNQCWHKTWCYAYVDETPSTPCYRWTARGNAQPVRTSPPQPNPNYGDEDDFCKNGIPV